MRKFLRALFLIAVIIGVGSCKKHKPAKEAFLITARNVKVKTLPGQGSGAHKITDLWLYVDGKYQGAYEVGNAMPVPSGGKPVTINVFAGIKNNGISNTRIPWLFYNFITFDTLVESGSSVERDFTFDYKSSATFTWTENFENALTLTKSSNSEKGIVSAPAADCFEGKSGLLQLDADDQYVQIQSTNNYALPTGNPNVYLELNYKCTTPFEVGLIGSSTEQKSIMTINAQENWNKIYIQLASAVNASPISDRYYIYFKATKPESDGSVKNIFLDNIKLLYF